MCERIKKLLCSAAALTILFGGTGVLGNIASGLAMSDIAARAETYTGKCGANVNYSLTDGVLTISGSGAMYDYTEGRTPWMYVSDSVRKVVIESGVTSVGSSAFYGFTALSSVTIADTVKNIADHAFCSCGLKTVSLPNSVETISESAFGDCLSLTSAALGSSVKTIDTGAFAGCVKLSSVNIPASVTAIGGGAFTDTPWLAAKRSGGIAVVNGFLLDGSTASGSVTLSSDVKHICGSAFAYNSKLTGVTLPSGLLTIGDHAFESTGLTSLALTAGISEIGARAFAGCTKLASVSMPYGFNALSRGIFADCKALSSVDLSSTIIDIPESAFSGCTSLKKVDIPLSVETIGEQAFGGCTALATVNFPEVSESTEGDADNSSLENISGTAFTGTKWLADKQKTSPLVIVNKLLVNGQAAKGTVVIPGGTVKICDHAFADNYSLVNVSIPDSVVTIGEGAFIGCTKLMSAAVPDSVEGIADTAFGFVYNSSTGDYEPSAAFTLYCGAASRGETYAKESGVKYQTIKFDGTNALKVVPASAGTAANKASVAVYKGASKVKDVVPGTNGFADLSGLAAGEYKLVISCTGFAPRTLTYRTGSAFGGVQICKYGDVNGDGSANSTDVALLQQYIGGWNVYYTYDEAADVTADGKIDQADVARYQQTLSGWNVELGKK